MLTGASDCRQPGPPPPLHLFPGSILPPGLTRKSLLFRSQLQTWNAWCLETKPQILFLSPDGWKPRNWDQCSPKVWVLNTDGVILMSSPRGDLFGHGGR